MKGVTYGSRQLNKLLDDTLMEKHHFASETLMELAGLAVAQVAHKILKRSAQQGESQSVCVLVGPGNNGGDGLVAARHLSMMRYKVDLIVFKQLEGKNGNYHHLCNLHAIPTRTPQQFKDPQGDIATQFRAHLDSKQLIIDSIFGFPFTGQIRQPYKDFIQQLNSFQNKILSVDIPSGWDANQGNIHNLFEPAYLISLGLPKQSSQNFKGEHYFGGRFVPESICEQLGITLPQYEEDALYCRL